MQRRGGGRGEKRERRETGEWGMEKGNEFKVRVTHREEKGRGKWRGKRG